MYARYFYNLLRIASILVWIINFLLNIMKQIWEDRKCTVIHSNSVWNICYVSLVLPIFNLTHMDKIYVGKIYFMISFSIFCLSLPSQSKLIIFRGGGKQKDLWTMPTILKYILLFTLGIFFYKWLLFETYVTSSRYILIFTPHVFTMFCLFLRIILEL